MKDIDVFKLGCELGFDIRGAELNDNINSLVIINENCDIIPGFNSNKVIAYNCRKNIDIKRNSVAMHLKEYVALKSQQEKVTLTKIYEELYSPIDINLLAEECFLNGLIKRKRDIKRLYKKMH